MLSTHLGWFIIVMQNLKDCFCLDQTEGIKGTCQQFISQGELQWRDMDRLQIQPYKRVAKHIRNIQYTPQNTRTLSTLKNALNYLIESIFPLMLKPGKEGSQRVALFLEERLVAIRCEYFVQGIICPKELIKLIRCLVVVWVVKGTSSKSAELVGLQFLLQEQSKHVMESQFAGQYQQALKYAIFSTKTVELAKLLSLHQSILEEEELSRLLALRLKFQQNNYESYYTSLSQQNAILRCVIWLKIQDVKAEFAKIVKKAFGDVSASWLCKRMCVLIVKPESWFTAKNIAELEGYKHIGFQEWIGLEVLEQALA